jgi:hypothetical protein
MIGRFMKSVRWMIIAIDAMQLDDRVTIWWAQQYAILTGNSITAAKAAEGSVQEGESKRKVSMTRAPASLTWYSFCLLS